MASASSTPNSFTNSSQPCNNYQFESIFIIHRLPKLQFSISQTFKESHNQQILHCQSTKTNLHLLIKTEERNRKEEDAIVAHAVHSRRAQSTSTHTTSQARSGAAVSLRREEPCAPRRRSKAAAEPVLSSRRSLPSISVAQVADDAASSLTAAL
jgi:cell wall-associated NlpC family hydrolase